MANRSSRVAHLSHCDVTFPQRVDRPRKGGAPKTQTETVHFQAKAL